MDFESGGVFVIVTLSRFVVRRGGGGVDGGTREIRAADLGSSAGSGVSVSFVALVVDLFVGVPLAVPALVR